MYIPNVNEQTGQNISKGFFLAHLPMRFILLDAAEVTFNTDIMRCFKLLQCVETKNIENFSTESYM